MISSSIPAILRERASLQPDDVAFTFLDYDKDWEGVPETLTWAQVYRRSVNLALELGNVASPGDRAVVVAPQTLDYLVGFLGALQAGLIAVPLSMPIPGQHDERTTAVIRDCAPTVILTTSAIVDDVAAYANEGGDQVAPTVIEVDRLELDGRKGSLSRRLELPETAYLQYTSGSTRTPAGVMVSYRNLSANFEQIMADMFPEYGKLPPPGSTSVTWLPFYHDMGLMLGVCAPILGGWPTVFTTPLSFLARPARWVQQLGINSHGLTAAPNFAFDLTAARTSDEDMAGLDLGGVVEIMSGSERVHETTLKRFIERFAKFNLPASVVRPSYGLAEATLYAAMRLPGEPAKVVHFEPDKLSAGHAKPCGSDTGTPLIAYGTPHSPKVKIVDAESRTECPAGSVGEIWVQGENVCLGYWQKPELTEYTFGARLVDPVGEGDDQPWLRTGDLGFMSDNELYIMGRIKDILIVRGRNHYPDDIEAAIQTISGGARVAAIAVQDGEDEALVAIVEVKPRGETDEEKRAFLETLKGDIATAIANAHGLVAADLVLAPRGTIPITTSGKIRRASCAEMYRNGNFSRLDA